MFLKTNERYVHVQVYVYTMGTNFNLDFSVFEIEVYEGLHLFSSWN